MPLSRMFASQWPQVPQTILYKYCFHPFVVDPTIVLAFFQRPSIVFFFTLNILLIIFLEKQNQRMTGSFFREIISLQNLDLCLSSFLKLYYLEQVSYSSLSFIVLIYKSV